MMDETEFSVRPVPVLAVVLFVSLWMACGWLLALDADTYLMLGVPITILFQLTVRRQSLRALWVREAPPFRLDGNGIAIALALSVVPLAGLSASLLDSDLLTGLHYLFGVVGAAAAAYSLRNFNREHLRSLWLCLLVTIALDTLQWSLVIGLGLISVTSIAGGMLVRPLIGIASLLEYITATFVIEEVTFRMLDGHLRENARIPGMAAAILVSVAWGLWHLPVVGEELDWLVVAGVLCIHVPYGICLSYFWWKTGNLFIPALCHSLGDAIRNMIVA